MSDQLRRLWLTFFLLPVLNAQTPLVSVTPSAGYGSVQSFTAVYADSRGYQQLSSVSVLFSNNGATANACWLAYDQQTNTLKLARDDGATWDRVNPGGAAQNSQCKVRGSDYSVTEQQSTLTLAFLVVFKPSFAGMKSIYLEASPQGLPSTELQAKGTWNVLDAPDFNILVKPAVLRVPRGVTASFDILATDNLGPNTTPVSLYVINLPAGVTATFDPALISLGGSAWSKLVIQTGSNAAVATSDILVIASSGMLGHSMGAQLQITAGPQLMPVSVSPAAGIGLESVFSAMFSDSRGQENISGVNLLVNTTFTAMNACWLYYDRERNRVALARDNAALWDESAAASGALQNSQCSVGPVSASGSGQQFTLTIPITFKAAFAGAKTIYTQAFDHGLASGYQAKGSWTVFHSEFAWVSRLSGPGSATPRSVATTANAIYVAGSSMLNVSPYTVWYGLVQAYDLDGNTRWADSFTDPPAQMELGSAALSIAADAAGVYVGGRVENTPGSPVATLRMYSTGGTLLWSRTFPPYSYGDSVGVDSTGVYLALAQKAIVKLDRSGNLLWEGTTPLGIGNFRMRVSGDRVYFAQSTDADYYMIGAYDTSGNLLWLDERVPTSPRDIAAAATGVYLLVDMKTGPSPTDLSSHIRKCGSGGFLDFLGFLDGLPSRPYLISSEGRSIYVSSARHLTKYSDVAGQFVQPLWTRELGPPNSVNLTSIAASTHGIYVAGKNSSDPFVAKLKPIP